MSKHSIDFDRIRRGVLVVLYQQFVGAPDMFIEGWRVRSKLTGAPARVPSNAVEVTIAEMHDGGLVDQEDRIVEDEVDGHVQIEFLSITKSGAELVSAWPDALYEEVCSWLGINAADLTSVSNEEWRPLPIDRQTPEYAQAVEATEALYEVVRGDNGYAATLPAEHEQISWSLRIGLDQLKRSTPTFGQVRSLLLIPARWLATKFAGALLGEAAKVAVSKVLAWLASIGL